MMKGSSSAPVPASRHDPRNSTAGDETTDGNDTLLESARLEGALSAIDRQYATQTNVERRIFISGASGGIGKLVAHALRGLPNPPPVTLLLHRLHLYEAWHQGKQEITIEDNGHEIKRTGFDVELNPETRRQHDVEVGDDSVYDEKYEAKGLKAHEAARVIQNQEEGAGRTSPRPTTAHHFIDPPPDAVSTEPIHNLIVTTKAGYTVSALSRIRHRLSRESTICFLQNGMGIIDHVNEHVFPDPATRPNYMQGIITHGVNVPPNRAKLDPFHAVHAGHGTIALGLLPRDDTTTLSGESGKTELDEHNIDDIPPNSRYLLRTLTSSPVLCAVGFTPAEILQQQLEKLAVNSVLNTLTALIDNRNGSLLHNFYLTRTMRLMLAETSHVIRGLPELRNVPNVAVRFSAERLEKLVCRVAEQTKHNISSTLADVRGGRKTEVEYINGYIVRRGEEIGVMCVVNYAMMHTVMGKASMIYVERHEEVPVDQRPLDSS